MARAALFVFFRISFFLGDLIWRSAVVNRCDKGHSPGRPGVGEPCAGPRTMVLMVVLEERRELDRDVMPSVPPVQIVCTLAVWIYGYCLSCVLRLMRQPPTQEGTGYLGPIGKLPS